MGRSLRHWAVVSVALGLAFVFASDRAAGSASLSASVVGPATIQSGDSGFLSVTITNAGDATAHGVSFLVGFPDAPTLESNTGAACPVAVSGGSAAIGDLDPGATVTCTLAFTADDGQATLHHPWSVSSTESGVGPTGEYDVTIAAPGAPPGVPFNDDKADAVALATGNALDGDGRASVTERTDAATLETGESTPAGGLGGSSVWFSWTPSFTGRAMLSTPGSDFDTLLEAQDPTTSAVLAANDNGTSTPGSSVICFPVTAGTKVRVVAGGYGASGVLQLSYGPDLETTPCPAAQPEVTGIDGADVTFPLAGDTFSGTDGTWFDTGLGTSVAYQWDRCDAHGCSKIVGATSNTYDVEAGDVGSALRLEVAETYGGVTGFNQSAPTSVVRQVVPTSGGGHGGGTSSFFITVDPSKTQAMAGDLVDVVATIKDTSATSAQSVHAFVTTPTGTLLQGPPLYESGNGCVAAVNALGVPGQDCNVDYIPGGGATHLRYELKMTTEGSFDLSVSVTAQNQNPSNTTGYIGHIIVLVAAGSGPPPPPPANPPPTPNPKPTKGVTKTGTARANTLRGTARSDVLRGLGGNDVLRGLGGNDLLLGGAGNDKMYGGAGNDQLLGGRGRDLLYGDAGNDTISARDGVRDTIHCGTGRDTVIADKIDRVSRDCEVVRRKKL
jgi:Ca2+-binding RTX toxin-like protein